MNRITRYSFGDGYPLSSIGNARDEQKLAKWFGLTLVTIALALIILELTGIADTLRAYVQ